MSEPVDTSQSTTPPMNRPAGKERGILGRFLDELNRWQNLTSAMIALAAASWAWQYTQRQIDISREQLAAAASQAESAQKQLEIAAKQAENSRRHLSLMELDQRPYVWPTARGFPAFDSTTTRIYWNWDYNNIGKSPAIVTTGETFIKIGNGKLEKGEINTAELMRPVVVPVGQSLWSTVFSPAGQTQAGFDKWANTPLGIYVVVNLSYSDVTGKHYEVSRCFAYLGNDTVHVCDANPPKQ